MFILWNASRVGVSAEESRARYDKSRSAFPNGHKGHRYREYNDISYELFQVLYSDDPATVFQSYQFFAPMHFLRMLSYEDPIVTQSDEIVQALPARTQIAILDFGCGLAHQSRALGQFLLGHGKQVSLALADIPTLRKDFLLWLGKQTSIDTIFLDCTEQNPIPTLPRCDVCFATEFFEHVYDPVAYLERFHQALNGGGLLITDVSDHETEFMHVSPKLGRLRQRIQELGFDELHANTIFRKNAD
jgi:hypothetical protein